MNYCGTCDHIRIGEYPNHESLGLYRCGIKGSFDTLTKPKECADHKETDDLEARRELVRRNR